MAVDPIVVIVEMFKKSNNLSSDDFIALNAKYSILTFIDESYDSLHMEGDEAILDKIQGHIEKQRTVKAGGAPSSGLTRDE